MEIGKEHKLLPKNSLEENIASFADESDRLSDIISDGAQLIEEISMKLQRIFEQETSASIESLLETFSKSKKKLQVMFHKMQRYFVINTLAFSESQTSESMSGWDSFQKDLLSLEKSQKSEKLPKLNLDKLEDSSFLEQKGTFHEIQKLSDIIEFIEKSEKTIKDKMRSSSLRKSASLDNSLVFFSELEEIKRRETTQNFPMMDMSHYNKYKPIKRRRTTLAKEIEGEPSDQRKLGFFERVCRMCGCSH